MPLSERQALFLTKFLGVSLAPGVVTTETRPPADSLSAGNSHWKGAYSNWLSANERLDGQLNTLRRAILAEEDYPELATELKNIAEVGLNALTGNKRVMLMAALMNIGDGEPESLRKNGPKALAAIESFRAHLDGNEKIDACEGNPWDVDVDIRETLYPPLDALSDILKTQQAAS